MDNMIIDEAYVNNDLALTSNAKSYLITTSHWGKFLAVLGFLFSFFAIIGGLAMMMNLSDFQGVPGLGNNFMLYFGIGYIIFALIYSFMSYLLFSFCSKAKKSINNSDSIILEKSLNHLKWIFVIMGSSTIAFIALYVIFLVIMATGLSSFFAN